MPLTPLKRLRRSEGTYVRSSTTVGLCKKNSSELLLPQKIVNERGNFVLNEVAKAQHTKTYVSISLSVGLCKKNSSERFFT